MTSKQQTDQAQSTDLNSLRSEGDLNISPRRQAWQSKLLNEETRRTLKDDSRYFLHQSLSTPCLNVLKKCEGAWIEDSQGRRLLDFHGNNVHQVGFAHPRVIEAVKTQLDTLSFCTRRYTNDPAVELARQLTAVAPDGLTKVLFAPGGTTAIGMAIKVARAATGRFKMISMWDSFHGASLDAISVGGEAIFRKDAGPLLPGVEHVPPPDPQHCPWRCGGKCSLMCADYIDYVLEKEGDVAAVIAETVRSTPYIPRADYWKKVRDACDRHGALLILDEIPHALGRTGRMFSCEHYDVVPDMLVIGKGLGGGVYPLAALLTRENLDVATDRAIGHYTHEKNPVACAAGLATLRIIEEEGLVDRAARLGALALERLDELAHKYEVAAAPRGLGLLLGIELVRDKKPSERDNDLAERVLYRSLELGLNFKLSMGNVVTLTPALVISEADLEIGLSSLEAAIVDCVTQR